MYLCQISLSFNVYSLGFMSLIAFGCICLSLHSLYLRVKLFFSYVTDAESSVVQWFLHQLELILLIFYGCVSNYTCSQKKKNGGGETMGKKISFQLSQNEIVNCNKTSIEGTKQTKSFPFRWMHFTFLLFPLVQPLNYRSQLTTEL